MQAVSSGASERGGFVSKSTPDDLVYRLRSCVCAGFLAGAFSGTGGAGLLFMNPYLALMFFLGGSALFVTALVAVKHG